MAPTLQLKQLEQLPLTAEPSAASRELRRANVLLQLGVPTLAIGATTLAVWSALGRPNEPRNANYGCGGWYTPAIVGPLATLGLAATVYGALHRRRLRRAGAKPAPYREPWRILGVIVWTAAFAVGASYVTAQESICST